MKETLKKMLAEEQRYIASRKDEVTTDFPVIRSEIRAEILEELLRMKNTPNP